MNITLQNGRAAGLLLVGALLCALSACGGPDILTTTAPTTHISNTAAPTTVPQTVPETATTAAPTTAVTQTQPTTAAPTAPSTAPAEPTQCVHQYGQWVTVQPATCTANGSQSRQCELCALEEHSTLPATGHSWDSGKSEGNSAQCGGTQVTYTCLTCGITTVEGTPASHSFGDWEYEAYTYTIYYEPGSIEYVHGGPSSTHESHRKVRTCEKCGFVEKGDTPDHSCKRGSVHHTVTTIREVTCSQRGLKRTTCNICGWYEDYEYGKLEQGHAWESEEMHLADRSETADALDVEILTCSACGEKEYYYRWGDGPCICGQTPCVAADDWRDCESYCTQFLMYNKYRISIDAKTYSLISGVSVGDRFYIETDPSLPNYNPDGYILHPTWQTVRRDYVFNEEGKIVQFTVLWHDMEGNLFSEVIYVPDLPKIFAEQGIDEETLARPEVCFHFVAYSGYLFPSSVSYTG